MTDKPFELTLHGAGWADLTEAERTRLEDLIARHKAERPLAALEVQVTETWRGSRCFTVTKAVGREHEA